MTKIRLRNKRKKMQLVIWCIWSGLVLGTIIAVLFKKTEWNIGMITMSIALLYLILISSAEIFKIESSNKNLHKLALIIDKYNEWTDNNKFLNTLITLGILFLFIFIAYLTREIAL